MKFFRTFFKSKVGLGITLGFLALIAFAFTTSDVANTSFFGGVAGGDRVAVVGDRRISTSDLTRAANDALQQRRQEEPTASMPAFIERGGLEQVLEQLLSRAAIGEYARRLGLRAGDNLVNSEIRQIGAFRGPDGQFSESVYRQALAAQGLSDATVREDLRTGLLARQLLIPATFGVTTPEALARRYAGLFKERRQGAIAFVPSAALAPAGQPSEDQLAAFYQANRAQFIRPERRVIRYAFFDEGAVAAQVEPTAEAVAAFYRDNSARFGPVERRSLNQLIVPTQQQAEAVARAVAGGQTLQAAAGASGLRTSALTRLTRDELASQTSAAVADAVFATQQGQVSRPARGVLGWHVAQVTAIERTPGRSLEQARPEIVTALREQNRARALETLSQEVDDTLNDGGSLAQVAQTLGVQVQTTPPLTTDGRIYGGAGGEVDARLRPALPTAFQMDESAPQLAEIEAGRTFLIFDVARIEESAAAPLAEVRDDVVAAWRLAQGLAAASRAADAIAAQARGGRDLREAVRLAGVANVQIETIDLTREQLAQTAGQRVPPPLALLFSMAQGTAKKLEAERRLGFYIVDLQRIEAGTVEANDPLLAQARTALAPVAGEEYAQQLVTAMRAAVGTSRNEAAIAAVRRQLAGDN
ncbi:peptidylprolyl isomerase [Erythrobacteraceae bacterium CFH 75059]|uniref:peptidylprolyl isomerase n=1 Tax=Qipengyuania thermophila TaxID=2509361 RepID=UPI0010215E70|nr:peptidylprolyl isomerase [Qipengyuania thermophila]TCD05272.1 peptidylprolyl isomerase [Erythrobacteraceae bacterium CFH 75059]